jgi:hypothetical protein
VCVVTCNIQAHFLLCDEAHLLIDVSRAIETPQRPHVLGARFAPLVLVLQSIVHHLPIAALTSF